MVRTRKIKKIINIIAGSIPIIAVILWFVNLQVSGVKQKEQDFKKKISSVVVSSQSYYGRSQEFCLEDGVKLYFMPPINDKIMIGDSIFKQANTYIYEVYRRDVNYKYKFWASYNLMSTP